MKKGAEILLGVIPLLAACSGGYHRDIDITGQWAIAAYVPLERSSAVLTVTDGFYRFEFDADGAFFCGTDCNSFSGVYELRADSLSFDNIACTEMACDNDMLECALRQALPAVRTVEQRADSALLRDSAGNTILKLIKRL